MRPRKRLRAVSPPPVFPAQPPGSFRDRLPVRQRSVPADGARQTGSPLFRNGCALPRYVRDGGASAGSPLPCFHPLFLSTLHSQKGGLPLPKRYLVIKWAVYALATAGLLLFQLLVVHHIRLWGLTPYLPPVLVGAAASFEGRSSSPFFAAALGLLCDLTTASPPMPGFFCLTFTLSAALASFVTEALFSRDLPGCLVASAICLALTGILRVLVLSAGGHLAFAAMCSVAAREFLISLPLLLVVYPIFRRVHKRTTFDY